MALLQGSDQRIIMEIAPELASAVAGKRGKATVAGRFREQLRDLVARLEGYGLDCKYRYDQ